MLIAEARKQKNMTQKDLAAALHVSDRAVSKWERGAGFPDVSLLEPLADALGLQVLELSLIHIFYALDMCGRYFSTDSMTPVQ